MTDKLRQAAQQMLEAVADLTILTPREWQAVHGLKIDALRDELAEQPTKPQGPETLAEALYRYGTDFISHAVSRGIDDIEEAGCLMIEASKKLAEQPAEQEPVAWRGYTITNGYTLHFHYGEAHRVASKIDPLYTAPKPAKREPLTDEEIIQVAVGTKSAEPGRDGYVLPISFARAIERAHGIGGQP